MNDPNGRYIAFNAICCGTFDVVYAAVHPEILFPAPILVTGGFVKNTVLPDLVARLAVVAILLPLAGLVGSVVGMVVFRFCQTARGKVFFGLLDPWHFHHVFVFLVASILVVFILSFNLSLETSRDAVLRGVLLDLPDDISLLQHKTVIGVKSLNSGWTLFAGGFAGFAIIAVGLLFAYCVYGCYASLGPMVASPKTLRLYRVLINSMVLDFTIYAIIGIVPAMVMTISVMMMHSEWASTVIELSMCVAGFYPLASHVVWLTYITPYRRAFLRMIACRRHRKTSSKAPLFLASSSWTRA